MKRILQINETWHRGGSQVMVMNAYRALDKTKFQFDFLCFTDKYNDFDKEIEELGGKIYRIPSKNRLLRVIRLMHLIKNNPQWSAVHCHMLFGSMFYIYAAKKAGIKQRIVHSHRTSDNSRGWLRSLFENTSRKVLRRLTTDFLACNQAAGKYLFPHIDKVQVIPNSIDLVEFSSNAENNSRFLRNEFNLKDNTLVLLQLGRFSKEKNHSFSLKIAQKLKERNVDFKLFFVGEGNTEARIKEQVNFMGLDKEIIFLGLRTDIPRILGSSDVLLLPSVHEAFPMVLIESQTVGVPALVSDTVPVDVDLDLNLITFESLNASSKKWSDKLMKELLNTLIPSIEKRLLVLRERGFDVSGSARKLEKIYSKN